MGIDLLQVFGKLKDKYLPLDAMAQVSSRYTEFIQRMRYILPSHLRAVTKARGHMAAAVL